MRELTVQFLANLFSVFIWLCFILSQPSGSVDTARQESVPFRMWRLDAAIRCRIQTDRNRKWQSMYKSHLINSVRAFWAFLELGSILFKLLKSTHQYFLFYIMKRVCLKSCSSFSTNIPQQIYILYLIRYSKLGGKGRKETLQKIRKLPIFNFLTSRTVGLLQTKVKKKKKSLYLCIWNLLGANLTWQWDESWIHASFNIRGLECSLLSIEVKQFTGNRLLSTSRSAK